MGSTCHNAKSSLFPFVPSSASLSLSYFYPLCRRLAGGEEVAGARQEAATTGGGGGSRGEGRASPRLGVGKAQEAAGGGRRGCCFDTGWLLPRHQLAASSPATKWPGRGGGRSPRRRTREANAWMSMEDGDEENDVLRMGLRRRPLASSRVGAAAAPAPPAAAASPPPAASPFSSIAAAAQLLPAVACRGTRSAHRRLRFKRAPLPSQALAPPRSFFPGNRLPGARSACRRRPPLPSQASASPRSFFTPGRLPRRPLRPPPAASPFSSTGATARSPAAAPAPPAAAPASPPAASPFSSIAAAAVSLAPSSPPPPTPFFLPCRCPRCRGGH